MDFRNIHTVSEPVRRQIGEVRRIWRQCLGADIAGVCAHGSLALGCFREGASDIDLLIVTRRRLTRAERLRAARDIMSIDKKPCPLEMSAIWEGDLRPWRHPTPCQFHYSDAWTEHYKALLRGEIAESFLVDTDFEDADIACHVRLAAQSGVCLLGAPPGELFPPVPEADFWQSLRADVENYDFHAHAPRYFASNVLILGRVLSYKRTGRILSKYEGGLWMREHVPPQYRYIVEGALRAWYEGADMPACAPEDLEALRAALIGEIVGA